ncbi:hypothetical protein Mapa_016667 [Marchantia paleacea]|nr:hypothetical protein Mapa_016667 [Marchantia paleacea]
MSSTLRLVKLLVYGAILSVLLVNVHPDNCQHFPVTDTIHRRFLQGRQHVYFARSTGKYITTAKPLSAAVRQAAVTIDSPAALLATTSAPAPSPDVRSPPVPSSSAPGSRPPPPGGCCTARMIPRPWDNGENCSCVYPIEIGLLLDNASISVAQWSAKFQHELGSQLNLTDAQVVIRGVQFENGENELNLTVDIVPLTGDRFSSEEASYIEAALKNHEVVLNSQLFGNYTLESFVVFGPSPPGPPSPPSTPDSPIGDPPRGDSQGPGSSGGANDSSLPLIVGVAAGGIVLLVVLAGLIWKFLSMGRADKMGGAVTSKISTMTRSSVSEVASTDVHPSSTRVFTYEELREATNNFDSVTLLGEGGFGRVYRGVLKDGTEVAIKKLTSGGHQGDREFLVEVEMLSRLHHRHLVKLVGYFSSRDTVTQLLCYELVPNGSLESWLHGHLGDQRPLDWDKRMKIAIGSARGLAYLHEDSQPCVIHRDFKASNILLEHNFTAKVADFGLAKQAPEGASNYVSTRVMGTFGYVAPEYAMTGHLLVKSDVYSYGVVLLELLSGRKPVDMTQPSGQENLVTWARPLLKDKDRLPELADPRLYGRYPREDFAQVAAIAAACVAPEASQRPTMGEVVQSLKLVQRSTNEMDKEVGLVDTPTSASISNRSFTVSWQNTRPTSTTFESDGSSSIFSSGPISGLVGLDGDNLSRTTVISEDLQEGR